MSEKRFKLSSETVLQYQIMNNDTDLNENEVVDCLNEQQATITKLKELNDDKGKRIISLIRTNKTLKEENEQLKQYKLYEDNKRLQTIIADLKEENEQLRMKLKGDDYIMVSEMLSNLRKTGICDGCKNKDKPVEWYLERGFSITGQICDRYEPEV